jgi:hypothetical protein
MPILAAPKFAAGVVYGLVGENNLTEIETCAHDGVSMVPEIEAALHELISGDFVQAVESLVSLVEEVPGLLFDCKGMNDDITAIEEWASIIGNKTELVATVTKNFLLHRKKITADIADVKDAWA